MKFKAFILALIFVAPGSLFAQQDSMPPEVAEIDAAMIAAAKAEEATEPDALTTSVTTGPSLPTNMPDEMTEKRETTRTIPTIVEVDATGDTSEFTPLPVAPPLPDDVSGESVGEDLITIALDDVELIDVVRMFSRIANANIIATPSNLTARVTANLDNVAWRPALSSILAQHNLSLLEKPQGSGVYSISQKAADAPEPMIVETIFLDYTTVDEVLPVIERMLDGSGSVSTFPSRNAMVIRTTESKLSEIRYVVKDIDIQSQQVCIETQFMELTDSAIKQLGIRWDSLENLGIGFQPGPFQRTDSKERVTGRDDRLSRADRRSDLDRLDQRYDMVGDQFETESATVTEVADSDPIILFNTDPTRQITRSVDLTQDVTSDIADTFTRTIAESSAAILNVDSLNVVLSALKKTDGVSIVSNPKMIVANGATNAFFSVGQREPIISTETQRGTTDSPGDKTEARLDTDISTDHIKGGYLSTGIELRVIPTVKVDDLIEAQIEPSLRRKVGEKTIEGNSWPVISVKEIKTKFTLSSGQTVAIGGLTDTTDSKRTSKIPLLGDIPILGKYLFSHTRDEKTQIETIIFVSLTLVEPQALSDAEGIPRRAELVYKAQIKADMHSREVKDEIRRLRKAADELEKRRASKQKSE